MQPPIDHESWPDCPPGLLRGVADKLHRQRRQRVLLRAGSAAVVLLIAGVGFGAWWNNTGSPPAVPATQVVRTVRCSDMPVLLPQYVDHSLPAELQQPVDQHLDHSPACRRLLERLERKQEGISRDDLPHGGQVVASR